MSGKTEPATAAGRRSASVVMTPGGLAAAYPSALSFSRMAMRQLVDERWKFQRLRFDLDADGRGRALYGLSNASHSFHFLVLSKILPEDQQNDRNFAAAWDVTTALCEGPWNSEREEMLAREVPKQERGRVDHDTLVLTRANRSHRLYEHVIESLSLGRQPDAARLGEVGYIMRTTAFLGNGQSGTRPYGGFPADHPLRRSHYAQIVAAFALREFVCELVDHVAAAGSPAAVRLSEGYRRYLGLGNSTAAGLIRFLYNHPILLHGWIANWEDALAEAKSRALKNAGSAAARLQQLLLKAHSYFEQTGRPSTGIFAPAPTIAAQITAIRDRVNADLAGSGLSIATLCRWISEQMHPETLEIFNSILLELYPDIVERYLDKFDLDETMLFDASMSAARLKSIVDQRYGWTSRFAPEEALDDTFFWFHSIQAPADARRGNRRRVAQLEHDNAMETIRNVHRLREFLREAGAAVTAGEIVSQRPHLRQVIARVQAMADREYGELQENVLGQDYVPYPPLRRILAFYGLEKLESAPPKIVRGALLQGAPTARDVALGKDGTWPFPLRPDDGDGERQSEVSPRAETVAPPGEIVADDRVAVAEPEIIRLSQRALQAAGVDLSSAAEIALAVADAELSGTGGVAELLRQFRDSGFAHQPVLDSGQFAGLDVLQGNGAAAALCAIKLFDLAGAGAGRNAGGVGAALLRGPGGYAFHRQLALHAARKGFVCLAFQSGEGQPNYLTSAAPADDGPWLASLSIDVAEGSPQSGDAAIASLVAEIVADPAHVVPLASWMKSIQTAATHDLLVVLARPAAASDFADGLRDLGPVKLERWPQLKQARDSARQKGLRIEPQIWRELQELAARLLVQPEDERLLRESGFDAAKQF